MIKDRSVRLVQNFFEVAGGIFFGMGIAPAHVDKGTMLFGAFVATAFAMVIGLIRIWGGDE